MLLKIVVRYAKQLTLALPIGRVKLGSSTSCETGKLSPYLHKSQNNVKKQTSSKRVTSMQRLYN